MDRCTDARYKIHPRTRKNPTVAGQRSTMGRMQCKSVSKTKILIYLGNLPANTIVKSKKNRIRVASIATSLPWQMWEVIWESNGLTRTLRMKACTRLWKLLFLNWNRNNCTKEGCAKDLTPDIDNANHRNE